MPPSIINLEWNRSLLLIESYWLGATDEGHEGNWTWMSDGRSAGTYSRQIGGVDFGDGEPDTNGDEYCAAVVKGKISDEDCENKLNYLCERPSTSS